MDNDDRRRALIARVKRANPAIDRVPEPEVGPVLRARLEQELAAREPSMDRLIPLGVRAREASPAAVNTAVLDWMSTDDAPKRTEAAAWFLAGYWHSQSPAVSQPLVQLALDRLELSGGRPLLLEPLLMALAYVPTEGLSPELRSRIIREFEAVRARGDERDLAPVAVQALTSVLGNS